MAFNPDSVESDYDITECLICGREVFYPGVCEECSEKGWDTCLECGDAYKGRGGVCGECRKPRRQVDTRTDGRWANVPDPEKW